MLSNAEKSATTRLCNRLNYCSIISLLFVMFAAATVQAGSREQAEKMHNRLGGVPPSAATLNSMTTKIENEDTVGATYKAMDNSAFYNTTLKDFATP